MTYYASVPSDFITTIATSAARDAIPAQYELPDEILRWQPPMCFICKERHYNYTEIPYDSNYNSEIICGDCFHKICDPAIKTALAEKEGKDE